MSVQLAIFLCCLLGIANLCVLVRQIRKQDWWGLISPAVAAVVFLVLAGWGLVADLRGILKTIGAWLRLFLTPLSITGLMWGFLLLFLWKARYFTRGMVGWVLLNVFTLILLVALASSEQIGVAASGDHLAVLLALGATVYFVWFGIRQAVANDQRIEAGDKPWEGVFAEKVPTWPDLVYIEAICAIVVLAALAVWGLSVRAPLEAPANPAITPNPAKAPWYFVGLQELLVYFHASLAGTVLPLLAVIGLLLIPFLDPNPRGNGYYTLRERPVAIAIFLFGFLGLWWYLIVVGMFFRGANWAFVTYSPAATLQTEVRQAAYPLSAIFWEKCLGVSWFREDSVPPSYPRLYAFVREAPGMVLLTAYLVGLPWWLARTWCRPMYERLGRGRYWCLQLLLLIMISIPIKILLRWLCNLSYVLALPEWRLFF